MARALAAVLFLLVLNGSFLYSFDSPTLFYVANVLLHALGGLAALVLFLFWLKKHFRTLDGGLKIAVSLLVLGGFLGAALIYTGTSRPYQWLLHLHIAVAVVGVLVLVAVLIRRRQSWRWAGSVTALAFIFPLSVEAWRTASPDPSHKINNPIMAPLSMDEEGAGPDSPFFPSAADTTSGKTIPSNFFMEPESCATSSCHPDIYEQWESSAHHFSSFNNQWYRKSIEYMQDVVGTEPSKWCAGCHDHAVFFNGMMDTPAKEIINTPEAQAGLTCNSCHAIVAVNSSMGNGDFIIEYPPLHDLSTSENPIIRGIHDFVVHLDPGPHRNVFMKPFIREQTAEYCSVCHKVHLDQPVNDYRWIRGFNEYDGWQSSGVSGLGARSFYYPEKPMKCVDCHMPLTPSNDKGNIDGLVHNHRFPGANTALPFVNQDEEQLRLTTEFLRDDQIGVDIFALSEAPPEESDEAHRAVGPDSLQVASTFAEGDELGFAVGRTTGYTEPRAVVAPIDRVKPVIKRGDTVRVDVVVRTKKVGHFFPGGTVDAFDVWVELKAEDENGRVLFWSGYVPEDERGKKGPVDPGAHFYRSFLLDEHGNPINKRNAWAARSVLYVRLIPPGAADTVHFRMEVPEWAGDTIRLTAKVNYRKFSWWNTQFAFAGIRDPEDPDPAVAPGYDDGKWIFEGDTSTVSGKLKEIPDIPIVEMATDSVQLQVVGRGASLPEQKSILHPADLIRWNDYGIGLFLQGDIKAAEDIFRRVTEIDPNYADGWVNIARVQVREGRIEEAREILEKALQIDPELAKTHYFLGLVYKRKGEYDRALEHFRRAESKYPKDRVVLNEIGRILFLKREFEDAINVLHQVLRIDSEDLQAHYNLMLAYKGLGDQENALREQQLYLRYKADESSQAITGEYRRRHPEDNNERQAIHEHTSYPLEKIGKPWE